MLFRSRLAAIAEAHLAGRPVADAEIAREIRPCFQRHGARRTDRVVLACTHYPFLIEHFRRLAPWEVEWIDPAPAIARRVTQLLGAPHAGAAPGGGRTIFTSGKAAGPELGELLRRLDLVAPAARRLPV